MHLLPLIRELSIRVPLRSSNEKEIALFLVDVLSRCTCLEHIDIPYLSFGRGYLLPIIEALNSHPSDNIRLQFESIKYVDPELLNISLSRVICGWEWRKCFDEEMKTLLAQGMSIRSIYRNGYVDDNWMDMTYPGLISINGWSGNERSLQSTIDFLLRHPLLERITLSEAHNCDMTPWRVAFASKMFPYLFEIGLFERNSVVKFGGEWLYEDVKVIFQDDISHGDVETVESMVRALSKALPQSPNSEFPCVELDFLSPVGEYLTSDDLISILTRNMNDVKTLDLGKFLGDILTRECSHIHEPGSAVQEHVVPAFRSFRERLYQALPRLGSIRGQTPQGKWMFW
ncbi:hypothetical protein K435DRAFT_843944 [Dendrothele bispora CBS 962.96]|uniref:F-box domain-containing protein n=1 Tax=Dendrothele bispora (strain CBS 962.96) TaxID=1314807 RepID=A0A4V4HCM1_DENBC|nr:hypothetical protein K435DRAFT_843944 [Dendrothele bispora CBS 962.96]